MMKVSPQGVVVACSTVLICVLLFLRMFFPGDIAAVGGAVSILAAALACALFWVERQLGDQADGLPQEDLQRRIMRLIPPEYHPLIVRATVGVFVTQGLWIGMSAHHPYAAAAACCFLFVVFHLFTPHREQMPALLRVGPLMAFLTAVLAGSWVRGLVGW